MNRKLGKINRKFGLFLLLAILTTMNGRAMQSSDCALVLDAIKAAKSIHPGDSRGVLQAMFTPDGGISTKEQQTFVFRKCPYIKLDVTFQPSSVSGGPRTEDVIISVSKLYLEYAATD